MTENINNQAVALTTRYNLAESAEWRKLLRHFDLAAGGFNFIVLLVPDADGVGICRRALADYLGQSGQTLMYIPLKTPDDLKPLAGKLLDLKLSGGTGAVWVAASAYQSVKEEEKWKAGWREGTARLNQFRNPLRDRINVTLIFAGATWLQEAIREMAPDLWSVRTLVVNIQPQAIAELPLNSSERELFDDGSVLDPELALREVEKLRNQPGKELALASMLDRAGRGLLERYQISESTTLFEQSLELKRRFLDSAESVAWTLNNLGVTFLMLGRTKEAIPRFEESLGIVRQRGDRWSESQMLGNLGIAYKNLGEPQKAIKFYEQSLRLHSELGDRRGVSADLSGLGIAYKNLGEWRKAIQYLEQALTISREIGDRQSEGADLGNLGTAYRNLGEFRKAIELQNQRLAIALEIDDQVGEGKALWNIAITLNELGERAQSIENAKAALKIFEKIESPDAAKVREQLAQWSS